MKLQLPHCIVLNCLKQYSLHEISQVTYVTFCHLQDVVFLKKLTAFRILKLLGAHKRDVVIGKHGVSYAPLAEKSPGHHRGQSYWGSNPNPWTHLRDIPVGRSKAQAGCLLLPIDPQSSCFQTKMP